MRYVVEVNGERHEVDVDADGARTDALPQPASLREVQGTPLSVLTIGDEVHSVAVRRGAGRGSFELDIAGHRYVVEAQDERTRTIRDLAVAASRPAGPAPLTAPMPGLVVRVSVQPGDTVESGQGIVVMEAMKMENELRSSAAGRVRSVKVAPGQVVEKGALLVELE